MRGGVSLTFGPDVRLYYKDKDGSQYHILDTTHTRDESTVYIHDAAWSDTKYQSMDQVQYKAKENGEGGYFVSTCNGNYAEMPIVYETERNKTANLLNNISLVSEQLANMDGIVLNGDPVSNEADGIIMSVYTVSTVETSCNPVVDGQFGDAVKAYTLDLEKLSRIDVADNEYVIVNIVVPKEADPNGWFLVNNWELIHDSEHPFSANNPATWQTKDADVFKRLVWNIVQDDGNGHYAPFDGQVLFGGAPGGTIMAPKTDLQVDGVADASALIADSVVNYGVEIHQSTLDTNRRTYVKMTKGPQIKFPVKKTVTGKNPTSTDEYIFVLEAKDNAPMPQNNRVTITGAGMVFFDAIEFDKTGTFVYTIKERIGNAVETEYDQTTYTVTVVVDEDVTTGVLTAIYSMKANEADAEKKTAEFTNISNKVYYKLPVEKVIKGFPPVDREGFVFRLVGCDGAPMPVGTSGDYTELTLVNAGKSYFENICYTKDGEYKYLLKEVIPENPDPNCIYDETQCEIIVKVTTNLETGHFIVTPELNFTLNGEPVTVYKYDEYNNATQAIYPLFTNSYPGTQWEIGAIKKINGEAPAYFDIFEFELKQINGQEAIGVPQVVTNEKASEHSGEYDRINFAPIVYRKSDVGNTYTYLMTEITRDGNGYTCDKTQYRYVVKVSEDDNGNIVATTTEVKKISEDGTEEDYLNQTPLFNNTFEYSLQFGKLVDGRTPTNNEVFSFDVYSYNFETKSWDTTTVSSLTNDKDVINLDWKNIGGKENQTEFLFKIVESPIPSYSTQYGMYGEDKNEYFLNFKLFRYNNRVVIKDVVFTDVDGNVLEDSIVFNNEDKRVNIEGEKHWLNADNNLLPDAITILVWREYNGQRDSSFNNQNDGYQEIPVYKKSNGQYVWGEQIDLKNLPYRIFTDNTEYVYTYHVSEKNPKSAGPRDYNNKYALENGDKAIYTIDGEEVEFTVSYDANSFDITNTGDAKTSISVSKAWINADETTMDWPADVQSVEVHLCANDEDLVDPTKPETSQYAATLTKPTDENPNADSYTWEDLPITDDDGNEITYSVKETPVSGYRTTVSAINANGYIEVTNTRKSGSWTPSVTKTVDGKVPAEGQTFNFTLSGTGIATQTKENDGNGTVTFDSISYDTEGTYTYTIQETDEYQGIVKDTAVYTVEVKVEDKGGNQLTVTPTIMKNDKAFTEDTITFENKTIKLKVKKVKNDENQSPLSGVTLTIYERTTEGIRGQSVVSWETDGTEKEVGSYLKTNQRYELVETPYSGYVSVADIKFQVNADGTIVWDNNNNEAESSLANGVLTVVNKEAKASFTVSVTKTVTGTNAPNATFKFTMEPASTVDTQKAKETGALKTDTVEIEYPAAEGASLSGEFALEFSEAGTYRYKVQETSGSVGGYDYDDTVYDVSITVPETFAEPEVVVTKNGTAVTEIAFENSYRLPLTLNVSKIDRNNNLVSGATLKLYEKSGETETPVTDAERMTNGTVTTYDFGSYLEVGKNYVLKEEAPLPTGFAGISPISIAVATDGTITVSSAKTNEYDYNSASGSLTIYDDMNVKAQIYVKKSVVGASAESTKTYAIVLTAVNGAPMPGTDNPVTLNLSGTETTATSFGEITYTQPGTYTYEVKESFTSTDVPDGWSYDTNEYNVTVTVTAQQVAEDGTVTAPSANVTYKKNNQGAALTNSDNTPIEITNNYRSTSLTLKVRKDVSGLVGGTEGFTFTLAAHADNPTAPLPSGSGNVVTVTDDHTASFGAITYTTAGSYKYTIAETCGTGNGMTYEDDLKVVEVIVADDLTCSVTGDTDFDGNSKVQTVRNTYTFKVKKTDLNGNPVLGAKLGVYDVDDQKVTDWTTVAADADGHTVGANLEVNKVYTLKETSAPDGFTTVSNVTFMLDEQGVVQILSGQTTGDVELVNGVLVIKDTMNVTAQIYVKKNVVGAPAGSNTTYTIQVTTDEEDTPLPDPATVTFDANEYNTAKAFTAITYTKPGTYTYKVKETNTSAPEGWTYDSNEYTVTVTVGQQGADGTCPAVTVKQGTQDISDTNPVEFTNSYTASSTTLQLGVRKNITGPVGTVRKPFTFVLAGVADNKDIMPPMPVTNPDLTISGPESGLFNEITYTSAGTYRYTICEQQGNEPGYTYDTAVRNVTVTVEDKDARLMVTKVECAVTENGTPTPEELPVTYGKAYVSITNTYSTGSVGVNLQVSKSMSDNFPTTESFSFKLTPKGDAPAPKSGVLTTTATTSAHGTFDTITFTATGNYNYVINEVNTKKPGYVYDTTDKNVLIKVTDQGGALKADVIYMGSTTTDPIEVTNAFTGTTVSVKKAWEGGAKANISEYLHLYDGEKEITDGAFTTADQVTYTWNGTLPKFRYKENGTVEDIEYTVKENAPEGYEVYYGEGKTSAADQGTIVNVAKPKLSMRKEAMEGEGGADDGLKDATYGLYSDPGCSDKVTKLVTDEDGFVVVDAASMEEGRCDVDSLDYGTYYLKEEVAPEGYGISHDTYAVIYGSHADTSETIGVYTDAECTQLYGSDDEKATFTTDEFGCGALVIEIPEPYEDLTVYVARKDPAAQGKLTDADVYAVHLSVETLDRNNGKLYINYNSIVVKDYKLVYAELKAAKEIKTSYSGEVPAETFTFTLKAKTAGAPMPEKTVLDVEVGTPVSFGVMCYDVPGVYEYVISEVDDGAEDFKYHADEIPVTVKVEDVNGYLTFSVIGAEFDQTKNNDPDTNSTDTPASGTVTVVNEYFRTGFTLKGTKKMSGRPLTEDDIFSFVVTENGVKVATGTSDGTGTITFTELEYGLADVGVHKYEVVEVDPDLTDVGVQYDPSVLTVTVKVTDEGNGILTAEVVDEESDEIVFINRYSAEGEVTFEGTKTLEGRDLTESDVFTFTVKEGKETVATGKNDKTGKIVFTTIVYDQDDVGEHTYVITEDGTTIPGVLKNTEAIEVKVTVSVNADGTLTAVLTEKSPKIAFTNVLTSVNVSKVDIADGTELEGAKIQILDKDGKVVDEWVSKTGTHEILGLKTGETYTLHEVVAPDGYVIATDATFVIDENGKVTTTGSITEDNILLVEDAMTVVSVSKVDIADGTELEGATIQIIDSEGKVVEEWVSGLGTHEIYGLKTGEEYMLHETVAPLGYTLAADITFTLDENGKVSTTGTLSEDGILLVEDALELTSISVTKVWEGPEAGEITLNLFANGEKMGLSEYDLTRDGYVYTFTGLRKYDAKGKLIEYTVTEKGISGYTRIYINVGEHAKETKKVYDGGKIINREQVKTTSIKVRKVWSGLGDEDPRPEITLTLYKDGVASSKQPKGPDEEGWYTWSGLAIGSEYYVVEEPVEGFKTTYTNPGQSEEEADRAYNGGTITNTCVPKTGDSSSPLLWIGLAVLALLGIGGGMVVGKKSRR